MSRLRLRVKFDFVGAMRSNYIVRVHTSAIRQGSNVFKSNHKHTYCKIDGNVMVYDVTNQMSGPLDCP
jgi:hypothetical protein